jgi:hydroxymethylpyrimidine kinase/phosphomethylpyrimidine kinase
MVSTSGAVLLPENAINTLIQRLLPITTVLTPNLPEAKLLLDRVHGKYAEPKSCDDLVQMAKELQKLGPKYVLLKGGHVPLTRDRKITKDEAKYHIVFNVLAGTDGVNTLESEFLNSKNTHGTGCSLACKPSTSSLIMHTANSWKAAIAVNLATGMTVEAAVKAGSRYVEAGIKTSIGMGKGNGPINHFHSSYSLPFTP